MEKNLEKSMEDLERKIAEMTELLHDRKRICVIDTHTNMPHLQVIKANAKAKARTDRIQHKRYLIGVQPHNCTVKLDFGGCKIPILEREVSLRINIDYPMTCHDFDIWMTPIDAEQDYRIDLKYTDDIQFTSEIIKDVENHDNLAWVSQYGGMFGIQNRFS